VALISSQMPLLVAAAGAKQTKHVWLSLELVW